MLILNFTHPITDAQRTQLTALLDVDDDAVQLIEVMPHFDEQQPFDAQVQALLAQVPLTPAQWQSEPIVVMPPALNFIAAAVLAELHGRMGYFPPVVRTRPIANSLPRQFEVAEIIDLQIMRENARRLR